MRTMFRRWTSRVAREQAGQSLLIIAVAFVGLLVIIGLAIDLGLMYIERIQLGRACDAAALAGAQELPFEDFAARRAIQYLRENGYDPTNTELIVLGPSAHLGDPGYLGWSAPASSKGTVTIDCDRFEDSTAPDPNNSADKVMVYGQVNVRMNFMLFIGFREVPVSAQAVAENVSNVDVAIVYDRSGSMEFDTRCYGCYEPYAPAGAYPNGRRYPLPYDANICAASQPIVNGSFRILVAEAEYFTYNSSYVEHDYHREYYVPGTNSTYWALQREPGAGASGYRSPYSNDHRGANMMHMPFSALVDGHATVDSKAPRLDYNFDIPSAGTWYVWIRAQSGPRDTPVKPWIVHVGVDGTVLGSTSQSDFEARGGDYAGANDGRWTWARIGGRSLTQAVHQVNVWGGGPGFRLDKILVTNNPGGEESVTDRSASFIRDTTPTWASMQNEQYQTYSYAYTCDSHGNCDYSYTSPTYYMGPADTRGRTGYACHQCNYIYGLVKNQGCTVGQAPGAGCEDLNGNGTIGQDEICNNINDDLFDDKQPIRASKEAAKNFVKRMKARFDQVGFTTYSLGHTINSELRCVKQDGYPDPALGRGVWDFDTNQPDAAWTQCFGNVITAIDSMDSEGNTNIGGGLLDGLAILGTASPHYGRPSAAKVIVLMTDGQANEVPSGSHCADDPNLWPDSEPAKDCVIYYANQAKNSNIIIYTIGLGDTADRPLLQAVADRTGGAFYYAPNSSKLDYIFQQIADQIFLRLIQ